MRTAAQWLDDYGDSHRNRTNKALHWICVPVIAWCVLGLLWSLPFPGSLRAVHPAANWASIAVLARPHLLHGCCRSASRSAPCHSCSPVCGRSIGSIIRHGVPLWSICVVLFVLAWIGQFIGHAIEGKRPSFFKDLQFLMIGPLWLLADVYRRLGIRF